MCSSSPKKQRFFVTLSTADLLNPRLRSTASSGTWATDRLRNLFSNLRESHVRADNFKACENEMAHSHLERKGCRILIFFNNTLSHSRSVQSGSPGLRSPTGKSGSQGAAAGPSLVPWRTQGLGTPLSICPGFSGAPESTQQ